MKTVTALHMYDNILNLKPIMLLIDNIFMLTFQYDCPCSLGKLVPERADDRFALSRDAERRQVGEREAPPVGQHQSTCFVALCLSKMRKFFVQQF